MPAGIGLAVEERTGRGVNGLDCACIVTAMTASVSRRENHGRFVSDRCDM